MERQKMFRIVFSITSTIFFLFVFSGILAVSIFKIDSDFLKIALGIIGFSSFMLILLAQRSKKINYIVIFLTGAFSIFGFFSAFSLYFSPLEGISSQENKIFFLQNVFLAVFSAIIFLIFFLTRKRELVFLKQFFNFKELKKITEDSRKKNRDN